jgi:SAM-dependent methyltransferase
MSEHRCYLCGGNDFKRREGEVRDAPDLSVLECLSCGLVSLSSFAHITDGFYESSGMHEEAPDVGVWLVDTAWDDERRFRFLQRAIENKSVLDFGCGNGGFLLRARKVASRAAGVEVEERLKPHFQNKGLEVVGSLSEVPGNFDLITVFHVLEHVKDPVGLLRQLGGKLNRGGSLIVEVPSANDALLTLYRNKPFARFTYWSCHLFLFNEHAISLVATRAGLKVDYVRQIQRYSLANHMYWLAEGKPGGHKEWSFIDSPALADAYEKQLASLGRCDTLIAGFSHHHEQ